MKISIHKLFRHIRRRLWIVTVAYMVGIHNFYKGEDKTTDDIAITTEINEGQADGAPKD